MSDQNFYYKNNRLQKMRGLYYTVRYGGVSAAARHMNLSQPAVSLQIQALEEEIGVKLLEKDGTGVKLTIAGAKFYELSIPIIEAIDGLFDTFNTIRIQEQQETLRIAGDNVTINYILPKAMLHYVSKAPDTYIQIHHAPRERGLEKLRDGVVDIFVTPKPADFVLPREYEYIPFARFVPSLITLPNHPLAGKKNLSVKEISECDISMAPPQYHIIPGLEDFFQRYGIEKRRKIEFFDWQTTRRYVETGITVLLASNMILTETDFLVATPLTNYFPLVDCGYVTLRGHDKAAKTLLLIDILMKLFPSGLSTNGLTLPV